MKKFFLRNLLVCIFLIPIAYSQEISEEFLNTLPPGVKSDVLKNNKLDLIQYIYLQKFFKHKKVKVEATHFLLL